MSDPAGATQLIEWRTYATIASAVVAFVALLRPEISKLFSKLRGRIALHPMGDSVELGFGGAGATVGIDLVVRSTARDFFVSEIRLTCRRLEDGMSRSFVWGVFRPTLAPFVAQQPVNLETPAGFYLEPRSPRRLGIVFYDRLSRGEVAGVIEPLRRKWFDATSSLLEGAAPAADDPDAFQKLREASFTTFSNSGDSLQAYGELQRAFYWKPGEYELIVEAVSEDPRMIFEHSVRFQLSKQDSDSMYHNATVILRQNAGFGDWTLYFARPALSVGK
ncbi:MAG: hypothetical protein AMXMBFR36_16710 [Acidobacteriota bacterium]